MTTVKTHDGRAIDVLAVSTDDLLLTAVVRLSLLDDVSLAWLAERAMLHSEECVKNQDHAACAMFAAFAQACVDAKSDVDPSTMRTDVQREDLVRREALVDGVAMIMVARGNPTDYADGLHPTEANYQKYEKEMAAASSAMREHQLIPVISTEGGGEQTIRIAGQNLIFRPGGVQGGNVYTSWVDLMAAKALIESGNSTVEHFIRTDDGDVAIEPVVFRHEGGGPRRSCDTCLAGVVAGTLVHARGCGAALVALAKCRLGETT